MIEKHECLPGSLGIVNSKISKWNTELGSKHNGLIAFIYKPSGYWVGEKTYELPVGTKIEIVQKPKRINESGVQVQFKIEGDETIFACWWVVFKHKIDYHV